MTTKILLLSAGVAALTFGQLGPDLKPTDGQSPLPKSHMLLAADETGGGNVTNQSQAQSEENADKSAKMGEESGTHTGDEAVTPEKDTKKVDQPPAKNPASGNGDHL